MFKVVVNKEGSTFTGGLYPESSVEASITKLENMGYTVIAVTRTI